MTFELKMSLTYVILCALSSSIYVIINKIKFKQKNNKKYQSSNSKFKLPREPAILRQRAIRSECDFGPIFSVFFGA